MSFRRFSTEQVYRFRSPTKIASRRSLFAQKSIERCPDEETNCNDGNERQAHEFPPPIKVPALVDKETTSMNFDMSSVSSYDVLDCLDQSPSPRKYRNRHINVKSDDIRRAADIVSTYRRRSSRAHGEMFNAAKVIRTSEDQQPMNYYNDPKEVDHQYHRRSSYKRAEMISYNDDRSTDYTPCASHYPVTPYQRRTTYIRNDMKSDTGRGQCSLEFKNNYYHHDHQREFDYDQKVMASQYNVSRTSYEQPRASFQYRNSSFVSRGNEKSEERVEQMVEIYPGVRMRLRGASETRNAIKYDFYMPCECMVCTSTIFCIQDADYVICPLCGTFSPMSHDNNPTEQGNNEGVGLGFTMEHLADTIAELERETKARFTREMGPTKCW